VLRGTTVLFYSVYQMSEMTSLRQWLAFSANYLKPRCYRVPRYFSTVLTVAQNQWYRATLICITHTLIVTVIDYQY